MVAQREYDREGKRRKEAEAWVNEFLGHRSNRSDSAEVYVLNRWRKKSVYAEVCQMLC